MCVCVLFFMLCLFVYIYYQCERGGAGSGPWGKDEVRGQLYSQFPLFSFKWTLGIKLQTPVIRPLLLNIQQPQILFSFFFLQLRQFWTFKGQLLQNPFGIDVGKNVVNAFWICVEKSNDFTSNSLSCFQLTTILSEICPSMF